PRCASRSSGSLLPDPWYGEKVETRPDLCKGALEARGGAEMPLVRAAGEDLGDRIDGALELVLGVEEVRAEAKADVRPEVTEDLALGELPVHALEAGHADRHARAPARRVPLRGDLEAGLVREPDQQVGEPQRPLADRVDADLLDHVVAGGGSVERGNVGCAGEEAGDAVGVLELRLERERPRVPLPADEGRLQLRDQVGADVQPTRARPAAEPLHGAAGRERDAEGIDFDGDGA